MINTSQSVCFKGVGIVFQVAMLVITIIKVVKILTQIIKVSLSTKFPIENDFISVKKKNAGRLTTVSMDKKVLNVIIRSESTEVKIPDANI